MGEALQSNLQAQWRRRSQRPRRSRLYASAFRQNRDWSNRMSSADRRIEAEQVGAPDQASAQKLARLIATYSMEMTAKDGHALRDAQGLIPQGTSVSITFLAGETAPARVGAAAQARSCGFSPRPHISARRIASVAELESFLADLAAQAQIDRAFVVAGDLAQPAGPYFDALAVIKSGLLGKHGVRHVGISGYPEGHPDFPAEKLWLALREKHHALTDLGHTYDIITQ